VLIDLSPTILDEVYSSWESDHLCDNDERETISLSRWPDSLALRFDSPLHPPFAIWFYYLFDFIQLIAQLYLGMDDDVHAR
jgi:hypothetical protein